MSLGGRFNLPHAPMHTAALEAPAALKDYGLAEADLDEAAELIGPYIPESNPRPVKVQDLRELPRAAWPGDTPEGQDRP